MDFGWAKVVAVSVGEFVDDDLVEEGLDGLEVGHVAGGSDDGGVADFMQTLDVFEAGERAVRSCKVTRERWAVEKE